MPLSHIVNQSYFFLNSDRLSSNVHSNNNENILIKSGSNLGSKNQKPSSKFHHDPEIPIPKPSNLFKVNTVMPDKLLTKETMKSCKISRVVLISCSDIQLLKETVFNCTESNDFIIREYVIGGKKVLFVGWYNISNVEPQINIIRKVAFKHQLTDIKFDCIETDKLYQIVTSFSNFKILDNVFDTVFIHVVPNVKLNFSLQELNRLILTNFSNYGKIHNFKQIDDLPMCFRARFSNIRNAFIVSKIKIVQIFKIKIFTFHSIIELADYLKTIKINNFNESTLKSTSVAEMTKYSWLVNRHLDLNQHETKINFQKSNDNEIDTTKITLNLDKRVTIMIKNIPNKMTHKNLEDFVDYSSYGTYEFLCKYSVALNEFILKKIYTNLSKFKNRLKN